MDAGLKTTHDDTLWGAESSARSDAQAWIGCAVGARHRIVKHLGTGGMGHVFLAEHVTLGAQAAVKILAARHSSVQIARFMAEAKLISHLNHANIVKVIDVGEMDDESPYILMEYVHGVDLAEWLERHRHPALSTKRTLRILRQLACAIDHLHGQGIIHRDIKPENIIVDPDANDAVKLLDFGIAIREGTQEIALEGGLLGTPAYMAPEQVAGTGCGKAADLYALGALGLELLTGKPPYDYPSLNLVLAATLHEEPGLPSSRGIHIAGFDAVIARALARDPRDRFGSAREFVEALAAVLTAWGEQSASSLYTAASPLPPFAQSASDEWRHGGPLARGAAALAGAALAWFA